MEYSNKLKFEEHQYTLKYNWFLCISIHIKPCCCCILIASRKGELCLLSDSQTNLIYIRNVVRGKKVQISSRLSKLSLGKLVVICLDLQFLTNEKECVSWTHCRADNDNYILKNKESELVIPTPNQGLWGLKFLIQKSMKCCRKIGINKGGCITLVLYAKKKVRLHTNTKKKNPGLILQHDYNRTST